MQTQTRQLRSRLATHQRLEPKGARQDAPVIAISIAASQSQGLESCSSFQSVVLTGMTAKGSQSTFEAYVKVEFKMIQAASV